MQTTERTTFIDHRNISNKVGMGAGLGMVAILLAFQILSADHAPVLKLLKYLLLGGGIVYALMAYKGEHGDDIFIKGNAIGFKLSLIAGAVLFVANLLVFLLLPELAFSKYTVEPGSFLQALMISMMLFFETWVIGSIITFITVQYLKGKAHL